MPNTAADDYERVMGTPAVTPGQADYERVMGTPLQHHDQPRHDGRFLDGTIMEDRAGPTATRTTADPTLGEATVGTAKAVGAMALTTGGTLAGAALGGMTGPFAPVAVPVLSAAGAEAGNVASKYLGWQPGKWNEPDLSDLLAVGVPMVAGVPGMARAALPYTRAGQSVRVARAATTAQEAAYAEQVAAHEGRTLEALDTAGQTHADKLAEAEAGQADRVAADAAKHQAAATDAQATYTRQLDDYGNAITAHRTAADTAGRVVTDAQPLTPSWVRYQKVRDAAPEALVDYAPVQTVAKDLASAQGAEYLPPRVQERLARLQQANVTGTVDTAHEELKFWGPLTQSKNGQIRGTAKQIHGAIQDTLEQGASEMPATAGAVEMLRDARAAFRKEKALEDVQRIVQASGKTGDDGVFRFRPGNVVTQIDKLTMQDPLFRGSFAPGELEGMRADFMQQTGLPKVAPTVPTLTDVGPAPVTPVPRTLQSLRTRQPSDLPLTGVPDRPTLAPPVEPTLPPPTLSSLAKRYFGFMPSVVAPLAAPVDAADSLISHALLSPRVRPWFLRQLAASGGTVSPQTLATLSAVVRGAAQAGEPRPVGP